jgi:collagenase-like PrtC family protease
MPADCHNGGSIFAGLSNSTVASGRASLLIRDMDEAAVRDYIAQVHAKGWSFDFNLNSTCLSNRELYADGRAVIIAHLDWVAGLGVDAVTVSIPLLMEIIRQRYPQWRVRVSSYQRIQSVSIARRFENLGADAIVITEHSNRDFKLLEGIRRSVKCKLVLIANVGCIYVGLRLKG